MKKLIALVLSIVLICSLSVTAFAADSPSATEKVTVTIRKADAEGYKADVEYTLGKGNEITLKANAEYGKFDSWTLYTADGKEMAAGTDYEIVSGSLTTGEVTIKLNAAVIICANYDSVKTDPNASSNADTSPNAPATGDMTVAYAMVVILAMAAFTFGVKKVYSK